MPEYMLLLHDSGRWNPAAMSPDEIQAVLQRYGAWRSKIQQSGRKISGHKLRDGEGRVVKGAGGAKVTDGPYAEAREVIGGLFVVEASSYDEAVALCRDCPHLDFGTIEIREIEVMRTQQHA